MQSPQLMTPADLACKAKKIKLLLGEPDVDLWKLREFALSDGGLVEDTIRKRAWPKLVGLHDFYEQNRPICLIGATSGDLPPRVPWERRRGMLDHSSTSVSDNGKYRNPSNTVAGSLDSQAPTKKEIPECLDSNQIERDVSRCTWHLLTGNQRTRRMQMNNKHRRKVASLLRKKQNRLGNLINLTILRTYEDDEDRLRYYQGYHDVASIFMSALGGGGPSSGINASSESISGIAASMGLDLPSSVLAQVSSSHFRDAMRPSFLQLQTAIRLLMMPLICHFDREIHDFLYMCEMEPFFALSWIITWFSHDIRDTALAKRLFDAFLVSHPLLPLYVSVAMVCHPNNREEILMSECDFAPLHSTLLNLPRNSSQVGWDFVSKNPGEDCSTAENSADDESMHAELNVSINAEVDTEMAFEDFSFIEKKDNNDGETQSIISSSTMGTMGTMYNAKTPFQELLNLALKFMEQVPPRNLFTFSKRYHYDEQLKPMLSIVPSILLLQPHPQWGLVPTAPADWVLKEKEGRKLNRKDRRQKRNVSSSTLKAKTKASATFDEREIMKYLKEHCRDAAVIACGCGRGLDHVYARRRLRRIALATAVVVVIVAVSVALVLPLRSSNDKASPQVDGSCDAQESSTQGESESNGKKGRSSFVNISAYKSDPAKSKAKLSKPDTKQISDSEITKTHSRSSADINLKKHPSSLIKAALGGRKLIIPALNRQTLSKDREQKNDVATRNKKSPKVSLIPKIKKAVNSDSIPKSTVATKNNLVADSYKTLKSTTASKNKTLKSTSEIKSIIIPNSQIMSKRNNSIPDIIALSKINDRLGDAETRIVQPPPLLKKVAQVLPHLVRVIIGKNIKKVLRSIGNMVKAIRNNFGQEEKE